MSTLGEMVTSIVAETRRFDADWPTQVRAEISKAIRFYQRERFWFNETRLITFDTVADQEFYTEADHADIPNLLAIEYITCTRGTEIFDICMTTARDLDTFSISASTPNVPLNWVYFEQRLRFYPTPNDAYAIRINALIRKPAPADDDEADNVWMTDCEELIRSRAKRNLYLHHMGDSAEAQAMKAAEDEALGSLRAETSRRTNVHSFTPDPVT